MRPILVAVTVVATAYLVGAIPFSNVIARMVRGVDLRDVGSGTVSGTGLYRVTGFPPLVVAGVLDIAKGSVGPLLAGATGRPLLTVAAAGAAVAGHNWSVFLRFAGGRGLSPAMGALLVVAWPGAALLLLGLALGRVLGETAVGALAATVLLPIALAALDGRVAALTGLTLAALILAKRLTGNAPVGEEGARVYVTRLLLDRDRP